MTEAEWTVRRELLQARIQLATVCDQRDGLAIELRRRDMAQWKQQLKELGDQWQSTNEGESK